jgi:hypothetical protein
MAYIRVIIPSTTNLIERINYAPAETGIPATVDPVC